MEEARRFNVLQERGEPQYQGQHYVPRRVWRVAALERLSLVLAGRVNVAPESGRRRRVTLHGRVQAFTNKNGGQVLRRDHCPVVLDPSLAEYHVWVDRFHSVERIEEGSDDLGLARTAEVGDREDADSDRAAARGRSRVLLRHFEHQVVRARAIAAARHLVRLDSALGSAARIRMHCGALLRLASRHNVVVVVVVPKAGLAAGGRFVVGVCRGELVAVGLAALRVTAATRAHRVGITFALARTWRLACTARVARRLRGAAGICCRRRVDG
mmetsp:Transcript_25324/g.80536  ORF Transcript_25324/g.80536 Transcript_25324/m.80536 type:complete len:270 (+) Transcript_25324:1912-2721(+)